jgi:hypothetical protein
MGSGRVALGYAGVWVVVAVCAVGAVALGQAAPRAGVPPTKGPAADPDFPPLKVIELDVVDLATNRPVDLVRVRAFVNGQRRTCG